MQGPQPRRLVSGQFAIIRDSGHSCKARDWQWGLAALLPGPRVRRRYRAGQPRVAVLLRLDSRQTGNARLWARLRALQNYNAGRKGMSLNTEVLSNRRRFQVCAVLFLAALGLAGWARAQESATRDRIYVV